MFTKHFWHKPTQRNIMLQRELTRIWLIHKSVQHSKFDRKSTKKNRTFANF